MMVTHAENHGGGFHTEPAIEEMCGYMEAGLLHDRQSHGRSHRGNSHLITATRITRSCGSVTI
jgi:hypothetical protein